MINREEVKHIAKLARVGLTEQEEEKMAKELSKILDYIDTLNELDVTKVDPTFYPAKLENITRSDEVVESEIESKKLIEAAPHTKDKHVKVKQIL